MKKRGFGPARARKGETLIEVLISLLIVSLATLLLASMATASAGVNIAARKKDTAFYDALARVEAMDADTKVTPAPASGHYNVKINEITTDPIGGQTETEVESVPVDVYTSENLTFYSGEVTGP